MKSGTFVMHTVFIDGQEGTTGLQIRERLAGRADLELLEIEAERRKDPMARQALIRAADFLITCLPDAAAREAVSLIGGAPTRIIDPSTAHRTAPGWVYGFPELGAQQRERIKSASRVSVPGCHATGFIAALYPLVSSGVVPRDYPVVAHSLTGYSGGGRRMIAAYEQSAPEQRAKLSGPRRYALDSSHKHLPEMQAIVGLSHAPLFEPVVADFYKGMLVSVPLTTRLLPNGITRTALHELYARHYANEHFIRVMPLGSGDDDGYLNALGCNDTNLLELFVFGNDEHVAVIARLDNLGKGASGAAVQNLNLMIGADEKLGLEIP